MPAAARVGDMTAHGTPLGTGPGSANVLIGGMPAWRVGQDVHSCPLSEAGKAHVGGVIASGSTKVFVNNMPLARQGDQVVETGVSNAVVNGCATVIVG